MLDAVHGCCFARGLLVWQVWELVLSGHTVCACHRRTVDHTGPYVRMLLERLRSPKSLSIPPPPPTAAGGLEVRILYAALVPVLHFNTLQQQCKTSRATGVYWEPWTNYADLVTLQKMDLLHTCSDSVIPSAQ